MTTFTIRVSLSESRLTGLEALDRRRALALPDDNTLSFSKPGSAYEGISDSVTCEVDESFARLWFAPGSNWSEIEIGDALLAPSDVAASAYNNFENVGFRPDLPAERIRELYIAARFRACREQVRRLKDRIAQLKAVTS